MWCVWQDWTHCHLCGGGRISTKGAVAWRGGTAAERSMVSRCWGSRGTGGSLGSNSGSFRGRHTGLSGGFGLAAVADVAIWPIEAHELSYQPGLTAGVHGESGPATISRNVGGLQPPTIDGICERTGARSHHSRSICGYICGEIKTVRRLPQCANAAEMPDHCYLNGRSLPASQPRLSISRAARGDGGELTIVLRTATLEDAQMLLSWRNDPETRKGKPPS